MEPKTIRGVQDYWELFSSQALHPKDAAEENFARACFMNGANAVLLMLTQVHANNPQVHLPGVVEALRSEVVSHALKQVGVPKQ